MTAVAAPSPPAAGPAQRAAAHEEAATTPSRAPLEALPSPGAAVAQASPSSSSTPRGRTVHDYQRWYACGQHFHYAAANWGQLPADAAATADQAQHRYAPHTGARPRASTARSPSHSAQQQQQQSAPARSPGEAAQAAASGGPGRLSPLPDAQGNSQPGASCSGTVRARVAQLGSSRHDASTTIAATRSGDGRTDAAQGRGSRSHGPCQPCGSAATAGASAGEAAARMAHGDSSGTVRQLAAQLEEAAAGAPIRPTRTPERSPPPVVIPARPLQAPAFVRSIARTGLRLATAIPCDGHERAAEACVHSAEGLRISTCGSAASSSNGGCTSSEGSFSLAVEHCDLPCDPGAAKTGVSGSTPAHHADEGRPLTCVAAGLFSGADVGGTTRHHDARPPPPPPLALPLQLESACSGCCHAESPCAPPVAGPAEPERPRSASATPVAAACAECSAAVPPAAQPLSQGGDAANATRVQGACGGDAGGGAEPAAALEGPHATSAERDGLVAPAGMLTSAGDAGGAALGGPDAAAGVHGGPDPEGGQLSDLCATSESAPAQGRDAAACACAMAKEAHAAGAGPGGGHADGARSPSARLVASGGAVREVASHAAGGAADAAAPAAAAPEDVHRGGGLPSTPARSPLPPRPPPPRGRDELQTLPPPPPPALPPRTPPRAPSSSSAAPRKLSWPKRGAAVLPVTDPHGLYLARAVLLATPSPTHTPAKRQPSPHQRAPGGGGDSSAAPRSADSPGGGGGDSSAAPRSADSPGGGGGGWFAGSLARLKTSRALWFGRKGRVEAEHVASPTAPGDAPCTPIARPVGHSDVMGSKPLPGSGLAGAGVQAAPGCQPSAEHEALRLGVAGQPSLQPMEEEEGGQEQQEGGRPQAPSRHGREGFGIAWNPWDLTNELDSKWTSKCAMQ